jgi:type I restriction enzyme S subunit
MTADIASLVSDNLNVWTTVIERKSGAGRGSGKRISLYGLDRLRALILDLAVRGRLVAQDDNEEPAAALIDRIPGDWAAAKRRHRSQTSAADQAAEPRKTPSGWCAVTGNTIFRTRSGNSKLIKGTLYSADGPNRYPGFSASGQDVWLDDFEHEGVAIILSAVGARCGKAFLTRGKWSAVANTHIIWLLETVTDPDFAMLVLNNEDFWDRAGGAQPFVKVGNTLDRDFLLPPLAEQRRIVAKVDELMGLCDALELESAAAMSAHQALVEALLATLTASTDTADLATNWSRLEAHFDTLFTTEASVEALKQAVLELAVRGKLSDRHEWPTEPQQLGKVAKLQNGYAFKSEWFSEDGIRLVRNINVSHGHIEWDDVANLPDSMATEYDRFRLVEGDVVLTLDRPFISTGTKVARISATDLPALLLQRVGRFQLTTKIIAEYVYLWVCSPLFSQQIDPGRSNGVPHISSKQVEAASIFVPSIAEQRRIVAKVEELMTLCEALKARITDAAATQRHLADAIVERAAA